MWFSVSVSVYYFPTEDDDEDGPTFKDKAVEFTKEMIEVFCVWDCCFAWVKLVEWVSFIVFDPFVELFITLCIVVNTLFMALDHHDMDPDMEKALKSGNYVSSAPGDWDWEIPVDQGQADRFPFLRFDCSFSRRPSRSKRR